MMFNLFAIVLTCSLYVSATKGDHGVDFVAGRAKDTSIVSIYHNETESVEVTPRDYVYPKKCSSVDCKACIVDRGNGFYAVFLPSGEKALMCTYEMHVKGNKPSESVPKCLLLEEKENDEDFFNSRGKDVLFAANVGNSTYFISARESSLEFSTSTDVFVGVVSWSSRRPTVRYHPSPLDLQLTTYGDLVIRTLWQSPSKDQSIVTLSSPKYLLILHLSNDSSVTFKELDNLSQGSLISWPEHLSEPDKCSCFTELIPDPTRNTILLMCADRLHFVNITCASYGFRDCEVNSALIDTSERLRNTPLVVLYRYKPHTVTMFIVQDQNDLINAKISHTIGDFTGLTNIQLSRNPLKVDASPVCIPHNASGEKHVAFFTAIEQNRRYIYSVSMSGDGNPQLERLRVCLSCAILDCTTDKLLLGDLSRNSTFLYDIPSNLFHSTPLSAESSPILARKGKPLTLDAEPDQKPKKSRYPVEVTSGVLTTVVVGVIVGVTVCGIIFLARRNRPPRPASITTEPTIVSESSEVSSSISEESSVGQGDDNVVELNGRHPSTSSEDTSFVEPIEEVGDRVPRRIQPTLDAPEERPLPCL